MDGSGLVPHLQFVLVAPLVTSQISLAPFPLPHSYFPKKLEVPTLTGKHLPGFALVATVAALFVHVASPYRSALIVEAAVQVAVEAGNFHPTLCMVTRQLAFVPPAFLP